MKKYLFMIFTLLPYLSFAASSYVSNIDNFKASFFSEPKLNKIENEKMTIRNYKSVQFLGEEFFVQDITITCAGNNRPFQIPKGKEYAILEEHLRGNLMIYLSQSEIKYSHGEKIMFLEKYKALKYHIEVIDRGFNLTGIIFIKDGKIFKVGTSYTDYFLDKKKRKPNEFFSSFKPL